MSAEIYSAIVRKVYLLLLNRHADAQGLDEYVRLLANGMSKYEFVYAILSSDEFHNKRMNWIEAHKHISELLRGDLVLLPNYSAILEVISKNKKLPSRLIDVQSIEAKYFLYTEEFVFRFRKIVPGYGLVVDCVPNAEFSHVIDKKDHGFPDFYVDGVKSTIKKDSEEIFVYAQVNQFSLVEVKKNNLLLFCSSIDEAELNVSSNELNVSIVGRFENVSSIGELSLTFLHHLYDKFNCNLIDTRPADSRWDELDERYQRIKFESSDISGVDIAIYTDVFSNSLGDKNFQKVPCATIKIAYVVFDSTRLPSWWIDILNHSFDMVITTSNWGKKMIEESGVIAPVFYLPLSLDLGAFYSVPKKKKPKERFRFGCIGAFSERKNIFQLVKCFIDCFGDFEDVELVIHSPLCFGRYYDRVRSFLGENNVNNVIISNDELSNNEYIALMDSFDVYVLISKGECYSITPREAFALGKPVILGSGHAHDSLISSNLFIPVKTSGFEPASFEAFDSQRIGLQVTYGDRDICNALRTAYYRYGEISQHADRRIEFSKQFTHENLGYLYTNLISPPNIFLGDGNEIIEDGMVVNSKSLYLKYLQVKERVGARNISTSECTRLVVPVHDGGFFSVFNTFISHFVWNYGRDGAVAIIPDWRISTLRSYRSVEVPMSFCYGRIEDGNIFTKLFLPIPGMKMEVDDYDNDDYLNKDVVFLDDFNERKEPLLTYKNARELYKRKDFPEWRARYGLFYKKYFILRDDIKTRIDLIVSNEFRGQFVIGVHVKHPSHAIEQPDGFMPSTFDFVRKILEIAEGKKLSSYRIFLATDQDIVIQTFLGIFGDRVIYRSGVVRTSIADDRKFQMLSLEDKMREGHQIQNLTAADPSKWSLTMAEDVLIDAHLLAACHSFVHVTSNIATAVSYINPEIEMIYCE